jgi:asparagine synthase (glutamine-hydrolysing)
VLVRSDCGRASDASPRGLILFAAFFNFDGTPVDLPPFGDHPAPARQVKILGASRQAALVFVPPEPARRADEERGIEALGGRHWLVGRIRLDGRDGLRNRLADRLAEEGPAVSDARLCLHAYAEWGERCVEFLAGDFAFLLWDEARQCLIGVRDQMGKRVLFHAREGTRGVISDSLDYLARQGSLGAVIDDYWIADFLSVGWSREFDRTIYANIRRVAPAHLLRWNQTGAQTRRFWRLDIPEPLYLANRGAYTERFRELVSLAIADRLPDGKVGISMSGGLDSTTLAACTVAVTGDPGRVVAHCDHYEELMSIKEDVYASLAARRLGIELQVERVDDLVYDPCWQSREFRPPEPTMAVMSAHHLRRSYQRLARRAEVWFEGEGPDNALTLDRDAYLAWLRRRRDWGRLGRTLVEYTVAKGLSGWMQTVRRHSSRAENSEDAPGLPNWLNPDLSSRLHLEERVRDLKDGGDHSHPWHPTAIASFTCPIWQSHFAYYDFIESMAPMRWRHPYVDLRVLTFLLSLPPIPWAWKKKLLRDAMAGTLPEAVLRRPKTPLPNFPAVEVMRRHGLPQLGAPDRLQPYVRVECLPDARANAEAQLRAIDVYALDQWLSSASSLSPP